MKRICLYFAVTAAMLPAGCTKHEEPERPPQEPDVEIRLGDRTVTVPSSGGVYEISYTVSNKVEQSQVYAATEASWIGDFDCSRPGKVVFPVEMNATGKERECTVLLTYVYGDDRQDTVSAEICQGSFTFSLETEYVEVSSDGGTVKVPYTLTDPIAGAELKVNSEADWIDGYDMSLPDTVCFVVDKWDVKTEGREASLSVEYVLESQVLASEGLEVVQLKDEYDHICTASYAYGTYYGERFSMTSGSYNYYTWLSDTGTNESQAREPGGTYYIFDIYASSGAESSGAAAPEGTYTLGKPGETYPGTFTPVSYWYRMDPEGIYYEEGGVNFTEGTLTITVGADGFAYEAFLVDTNGEDHHFTFSGDVSLTDLSAGNNSSTLGDDHEADLSSAVCEAWNYGDMYGLSSAVWMINLYNPDKCGDYFQLQLFAGLDVSSEKGFPVGVYSASSDWSVNTFFRGVYNNGFLNGSWWYDAENGNAGSLMAPLYNGKIEISDNGDGTFTIDIECTDDLKQSNAITASWTGTPVVTSY